MAEVTLIDLGYYKVETFFKLFLRLDPTLNLDLKTGIPLSKPREKERERELVC